MDKKEAIEKARQKVAHLNKYEIHNKKIKIALIWINSFHFSSPAIIDFIVHESCKHGFTKTLLKEGLIIEKKTYPYPWTWLPRKIITLSKKGRIHLGLIDPEIEIWTGKIADGHIFHDYLIQYYISKRAKQCGSIKIRINAKFNKIYDATVVIMEKHETIGIEIEISRKKRYEVSNMLYNIGKDLQAQYIHEVHIVYPNETIKNQFLHFMRNSLTEQGNYVVFYLYKRYNNNSKYEKTSEKVVISQEDLKIKFIEIPFPPILYPKPKPKPKPKEPIKLEPKPKEPKEIEEIEKIEDPEEEIYEDNYFNDDDL